MASDAPIAARDAGDRAPRDRRIRSLRARGWSYRMIALEVHLSASAVRNVLLASDSEIRAEERDLLGRYGELLLRTTGDRAEMSSIKRRLETIADERQTLHLDHLLELD